MRQSLSKSRHLQPEETIGPPFPGLLCGYLRQRGHRPEDLFDALADDAEISVARWHDLLALAAAALNEPAIGLAIAQQASWRDFGLVGYLASSCASIGEALEQGSRYTALIVQRNETRFSIEGDVVSLSWPAQRSKDRQLADEVGVGVIVAMLRLVIGGEFALSRVDFIAPAPADVDHYRRYFGCAVHFDQPVTRLCFSRHYLDVPLPGSDPALRALLDEQAKAKLQQLTTPTDELQRLRDQLAQLIRQEKTRLRDLAELNCMSTRALQRHLRERGSSFQALLDETRFRLARDYLADSQLDLTAVANRLGYSEHSSFTRAFQQWADCTPRQWRLAQLDTRASK